MFLPVGRLLSAAEPAAGSDVQHLWHGPKQRPEEQHLKPIRLVFEDGTHKVLTIGQAQSEASRAKRDLIPTALHQDPPVYKLGLKDQIAAAEYKRQKERRKQEMEQRRRLAVKEIRLSADTQEHDMAFKLRQAQDLVEKNFRVKLEVKFTRWRSTDGTAKLRELVDRCSEWSTVTAPQVNEKLRRNTTAVYLTPKLVPIADTGPNSEGTQGRPQERQQMQATAL
ncbi:hypothetical protein WJX73_006096 [Symbiochloris irregularis]|uniref:Translation initiation factor 3 C-terminal domain-containing protein n=1 Tax=Symbiochloris irregularis TaxID=706552 RepID=A0AAW1PBX5_9CHLO